jgi:hypothetical protein
MEHLRTILDTVDTLEIKDGDYLIIMNALKSLKESIPQPQQYIQPPQHTPQPYYTSSQRTRSLNIERIRRYFEPNNLISHLLETAWNDERLIPYDTFAILIERIGLGVLNVANDVLISSPYIKPMLSELKHQYREMFLASKSVNAKRYREFLLHNVVLWKSRVYNQSILCSIPQNTKAYLLKVEIENIPPFNMTTNKISLGRDTDIARTIKIIEIMYKIQNSSLTINNIKEITSSWYNIQPPALVCSGITVKTREKNRSYRLDDSTTITYIDKMGVGSKGSVGS